MRSGVAWPLSREMGQPRCERCDGTGTVVAYRGEPLGCSWAEFESRRAALLALDASGVATIGVRLYRKMRVELLRLRSRFTTRLCPDCDGSGIGPDETVEQVIDRPKLGP